MLKPILRRTLILTSLVVLAACGPSQQPQDQNGQDATNAPAAANAAPAPAAPSAADQEAAKVAAEKRKLAALKRQEAALRQQEQQQAQQQAQATPPPPPACQDCGVIASITPVKQEGKPGMVGTLGGAAAGGFAGNQFGKGKGKTAMTVLGVIGGALAGREVEKRVTSTTVYQVAVNMDTGGSRTVTVADASGLAVGTRVHVNGNSVQPY